MRMYDEIKKKKLQKGKRNRYGNTAKQDKYSKGASNSGSYIEHMMNDTRVDVDEVNYNSKRK